MNESGSPTEQAFLDGIIAEPEDDLRRLVFADWLEENGQEPRAKFIRARVVLDTQVPEFGRYADAVEVLRDCGYVMPAIELPPGFISTSTICSPAKWWVDSSDCMERGLPSFAKAELLAADDGQPCIVLTERTAALFASSAVRGLAFDAAASKYVSEFLRNVPQSLNRLTITAERHDMEVSPTVAALVGHLPRPWP